MRGNGQALSYDLIVSPVGGGHRSFARLHCAQCGAHAERTITGSHNPHAIIKDFRHKGWRADRFAASLCLCPACVAASRPKNDPESELKKRVLKMLKESTAKTVLPPLPDPPSPLPDPMAVPPDPPSLPSAGMSSAGTPGVNLAKMSPQQRTKVRAILDRQFDDAAGQYLDGYSDQKVAEELGIPWGLVAALRETAYGPLRGDPDLAEARKFLREAQEGITQAHKLANEAQARVDRAMARIHEVERRMGMRS